MPRAKQRCSKWPDCMQFKPCSQHAIKWGSSTREMPKNWKYLRRATRDRVKARFGALVCEHCGRPTDPGEVDHIIPHSRGGSDHLTNLQLLCSGCHNLKTIKDRNRPW